MLLHHGILFQNSLNSIITKTREIIPKQKHAVLQLPMFAIRDVYCASYAEEQGIRWYHISYISAYIICHWLDISVPQIQQTVISISAPTTELSWIAECYIAHSFNYMLWGLCFTCAVLHWHPCDVPLQQAARSTCSKSGYSLPSLVNQVPKMTATYLPPEHILP